VDRVEDIGGGRVRYWYSDDGQALPYGRINVIQLAGAVNDRAGNGNATHSDEFARLQIACTWTNPVLHTDVTNDGFAVPTDALVIINALNARGAEFLPAPADFPNVPPPFYDPDCNAYMTPIDALVVINWINAHSAGEGESMDRFNGGGARNVRLGAPGTDWLLDSRSRDILISVLGQDRLDDNTNEDLFVGSTTGVGNDIKPPLAPCPMSQLDPSMVHDDLEADVLIRSLAIDEFFAQLCGLSQPDA
jgi:hypothetical protein